MSLGTKLREARRNADLSQIQAAAELNAEPSAIWRYESDRQTPSKNMLHRLALVYKKDVESFSEQTEAEETQTEQDQNQHEDGPNRPPSTRWILERTGLSVQLKMECNPESEPGATYYWNSALSVMETGFIRIGQISLQSIDDTMPDEMHPAQQAYLTTRHGPLVGIKPENLEETCNQLAKKCYDISQLMELAPDLDEENEAARIKENEKDPREIRKIQAMVMIDKFQRETTVLQQNS